MNLNLPLRVVDDDFRSIITRFHSFLRFLSLFASAAIRKIIY